jgi:hypothetical protein
MLMTPRQAGEPRPSSSNLAVIAKTTAQNGPFAKSPKEKSSLCQILRKTLKSSHFRAQLAHPTGPRRAQRPSSCAQNMSFAPL